jgi:hypothetical protein
MIVGERSRIQLRVEPMHCAAYPRRRLIVIAKSTLSRQEIGIFRSRP